jgi:CheY-like chemotaxis protein
VPTRPIVLVVDDDPDIRRSVVQALEDDGMTGIGATSGQEALRILGRDPTIALLLIDIMMPGITGTTLADHAVRLRPDVKIMFMTAYVQAGDLPQDRPVLAKPFAVDQLCATVRAACAASEEIR